VEDSVSSYRVHRFDYDHNSEVHVKDCENGGWQNFVCSLDFSTASLNAPIISAGKVALMRKTAGFGASII